MNALLGVKHTSLAERYLEEGVIMDERPGVHFVDGALGRRPAVLGGGLDVWEIVEVAKDNGGSVTDTAAYLEIDPRLAESAGRGFACAYQANASVGVPCQLKMGVRPCSDR